MKIILIYRESQFIDVLNLTKDEEEYYREHVSYDDFSADDFDAVCYICSARDVQVEQFDPVYIVAEDNLPVYDERHQSTPLTYL